MFAFTRGDSRMTDGPIPLETDKETKTKTVSHHRDAQQDFSSQRGPRGRGGGTGSVACESSVLASVLLSKGIGDPCEPLTDLEKKW